MTENKITFSNLFPNKEEKPNESGKTDPESGQVENEKDNAVLNLIYYSFYPATCMVPLEENLISIKEIVPDLMKAQSHDPILQETIKTFHHILEEKEDEILNLQRQIQASDLKSDLVEYVSDSIQTELTLHECNEMENKITILTKDIPEKNEKIHQLQQELLKYNRSFSKDGDQSKLKACDSKLDDLDEAYKNLVELEEKNVTLQNQVTEITEKYKILQYQYDDINDLKIEIEDAKIQRENDFYDMEETLAKKTIEIEHLNEQLKNLNQSDLTNKNTFTKTLRRSNEKVDIDEKITELKDSIYGKHGTSSLLPFIAKNVSDSSTFQNSTDTEIISKLMAICCHGETSEAELKELVPILKSISFDEDGAIIMTAMESNLVKNQKICNDLNKEQLSLEALGSGCEIRIRENLYKLDMDDLKKEFMKLENILNTINKYFKLTQIGVLNRMSRSDLIDGIIEKRATTFEIALHSFWSVIFNQQVKENEIKRQMKLTNADKKLLCTLIFYQHSNEKTFAQNLSKLDNLRNILLYGESSKNSKKESILYFMKIHGIYLTHDMVNHILPKYPIDIRGKLLEETVEDSLMGIFKFDEYLSSDFVSLINHPLDSNRSLENQERSYIYGFSWTVLNILSSINFEDELFIIPTKSQKNELTGYMLTLSTTTKKVEKSQIKFVLQKNIKEKLLENIKRIQSTLNNEDNSSDDNLLKNKSEAELVKILIKKKENLLKFIFKDTFSPLLEKIPVLRSSRYFSSVSKEKSNLDFWIKMVLERYRKEQIKDLQSFSDEDIRSCNVRLLKSIELLSPDFLGSGQENKTNRNDIIKMLFTFRFVLVKKLEENFIGKRFKFRLIHEDSEITPKNTDLKNQYDLIRDYFKNQSLAIEEHDLRDVVKRLYEIDCELFPGIHIQDSKSQSLMGFKSEDILDEIIYLRLSIASCMILSSGNWEDINDANESNSKKWETMKKVESVIFNSELMEIDNGLIDSERILLRKILNNIMQSGDKDDEKLKTAFIEIKRISCRGQDQIFDMTENLKIFNSIPNKKGKIEALCNEVEKIMNFNKSYDYFNKDKLSADNYMKLDLLLEDMEKNFSESNESFQNTWIFALYKKVKEIRILVSDNVDGDTVNEKGIRNLVINYLEDIKLWVSNTKNLQANLFSRINNLVRKLNSSSFHNEKKIRMSLDDLDLNHSNYLDEKRAFDKAISQLEERIKEIDTKRNNKKQGCIEIDLDLNNKSDDELSKLILSMENELLENKFSKANTKESKVQQNGRTRKQLEDDCHNLAQDMLMKKMESYLNDKNQISDNRFNNDYPMSQFEEELNMKLMKYQDVCDSVERLQVSSLNSKNKTFSSVQMPADYQQRSNSPAMKSKIDWQSHQFRKTNLLDNDDENVDLYFKKRLNELQNSKKSSNGKSNSRETGFGTVRHKDSDILIDGFEIEEEKTPRYYSMRLQDIKHIQKEDELGNILHQLEEQRQQILEKNKDLQKQVFLFQNLLENQQIKLDSLEKSDHIFRQKIKALESNEKQDNESPEDVRLLKNEINRLSKTILSANKQLDQQNEDLINLITKNENLMQENSNLSIKNKYLNHSFQKLEEEFNDLLQQLQYTKIFSPVDSRDSVKESVLEKRLRQSENEKLELVKKLDLIEQQNELLKDHCEKLDVELSVANKNLGESQSLTDNYRLQAKQLTDILDNMTNQNEKHQSNATNHLIKEKDEELKRLKNKIFQLEKKLIAMNQSDSNENAVHELIQQKDQEIMNLNQELGFIRDTLDEMKAQIEIKDQECQQMKLEKKYTQEINSPTYKQSSGYHLSEGFDL